MNTVNGGRISYFTPSKYFLAGCATCSLPFHIAELAWHVYCLIPVSFFLKLGSNVSVVMITRDGFIWWQQLNMTHF